MQLSPSRTARSLRHAARALTAPPPASPRLCCSRHLLCASGLRPRLCFDLPVALATPSLSLPTARELPHAGGRHAFEESQAHPLRAGVRDSSGTGLGRAERQPGRTVASRALQPSARPACPLTHTHSLHRHPGPWGRGGQCCLLRRQTRIPGARRAHRVRDPVPDFSLALKLEPIIAPQSILKGVKHHLALLEVKPQMQNLL